MPQAKTIKLAPSILAADFARLGEQVAAVDQAGADRIHIDVMDGHFVPNLSMGPHVVQAIRPLTKLPLEVHLMVTNPDQFLEPFARAGADSLLVHVEGAINLHRTIQQVRALGKKVGVVVNPATSAVALEEVLAWVDLALVMTVNPGFGGQSFIAATLGKIRIVREMIAETNPHCELEVDGGIETHTAPEAIAAGAHVLVAGSAIFRAPGGAAAGMQAMQQACGLTAHA